ncbi:MAG: hypothetical protein E6H47_04770 [Betaproteobacteria bacterium]|nr:MAG: hypothetical protein E6H47_04770 [Betaproteobacteria bacterium]
MSLAASGVAFGACTGPGAPTDTQTKCLTAVQIPGNPLRSFDISFVNPHRAEYYFADRSNAAVQVIDTRHLTHKRALGGFVGIKLNNMGAVDNSHSGPDGVVTHGRWLYAGDGDSTLKVFDLESSASTVAQPPLSTGGTTRVDEMDITSDGELLLVANNAEDPPYATLFAANGDRSFSAVQKIMKITVDNAIIPAGEGLSMEQPAWEPRTGRFYVSIPQIADNPAGCTFGGPKFCQGGLLVIDPHSSKQEYGAFDAATNTGVLSLSDCGPNGATVGPNANLMLGCTPQNVPTNITTQVINAKTKHFVEVGGLTGSDEVWYNAGDNRYYTGSNRAKGGAGLGVVNAETNFLIEKIPQGSNSHSVAADSKRNRIFVPQAAPASVVGSGGDTTTVGAGICGSTNGCVAVYVHHVDGERDDDGSD